MSVMIQKFKKDWAETPTSGRIIYIAQILLMAFCGYVAVVFLVVSLPIHDTYLLICSMFFFAMMYVIGNYKPKR